MIENVDPKEFLLFGLNHFNINVVRIENNLITLEKDYEIEIESNGLYRLSQNEEVIAPFSGVEELCSFLVLDMKK